MKEEWVSLREINLLPWREEYREFQRKQFIFFLGFGAALAITFIILLHFFMVQRTSMQMDRNNYLTQEIVKLDKKILEINDLQQEKQKLLERMKGIQRLQASRPNIVKIFDGIAKTVPDGLYFTNVARIKSDLIIQGKAESNTRVSKFMRNIEASDWLMNPILSVIEEDKDKNKPDEQVKISEHSMMFNLEAKQTFNEE